MSAEQFDGIVIGTGQAGKPLAGALAEAGWRLAVIERDSRVGGKCVLTGCTPTKTMVASARVAHLVRRAADYGVVVDPPVIDMVVVRERKRSIVDQWSSGSRRGMERHDTIDLIFGEATFEDARTVRIETPKGPARRVQADHVFINTGTRQSLPPVPGLDTVPWLDHASIMELGRVPDHLLVLGGGFIGLEFAQMFRRFGARVTILEAGPRLAPWEDEDVCQALTDILVEDGVDVRLDAAVEEVEGRREGEVRIRIGDSEWLTGSHLLVATGQRPNVDALDPAAAGLDQDEDGYIRVDDELRTSVDGVWALGDVNGGPPFTHVSYDDYRVVKSNLIGDGGATRARRLVPYALFTDPELGRVGLTEKQARERGLEVRVAKLPMSRVARAIESDETRGFMKVVVDARTDRLLGAAVLGVAGGEIATVLQVAIMGDLPYQALRDGVFSHPTLAESLNNLFMAMDRT